MTALRLAPSWALTTDHAASSYGRPVLLHQPDGTAYGPNDLVRCFPSWPWQPARLAVLRLARARGHDPLIQSFVQLGQQPPAQLICQRCGHAWIPRTPQVLRCARCKSPYWNRPGSGA